MLYLNLGADVIVEPRSLLSYSSYLPLSQLHNQRWLLLLLWGAMIGTAVMTETEAGATVPTVYRYILVVPQVYCVYMRPGTDLYSSYHLVGTYRFANPETVLCGFYYLAGTYHLANPETALYSLYHLVLYTVSRIYNRLEANAATVAVLMPAVSELSDYGELLLHVFAELEPIAVLLLTAVG